MNSDPICNAMEYGSVSSDYPNSPFSWSRCVCNIILECPPPGKFHLNRKSVKPFELRDRSQTLVGGGLKIFHPRKGGP